MGTKEKKQSFLRNLFYGMGMRDSEGKKMYSIVQLALFIFLSSTIVFVVAAGMSYYETRKTAMIGAQNVIKLNMELATEIINNHVKQAENAGYNMASLFFDKDTFHNENGELAIRYVFDERRSHKPTVDEMYLVLDKFMKSTDAVTGACVGFEPRVYPEYGDKGIAPFVRKSPENDTLYEWLNLPDEGSPYREKDWYKTTKELGQARWSLPFKDVKGAVITSFCIPVYNRMGQYIGTIAMDMNLESFSKQIREEIHPYDGSEIMLIGPGNMFLVHPDQECVLNCAIESIDKFEKEEEEKNRTLFYHEVDSDNMIVAISCPNHSIYKFIDELLSKLLGWAALGLILIEICALSTFRQLRRVVEAKASVDGELTIASNIQMSMLPMMFPEFPDRNDLRLFASLKPAKSVGGDLYDYVIRKNGEGNDTLVFTIGDVSGKGVPASLMMAVVCSLFRDMALKSTDPTEILTDINNCIAERNEYNMFCTMFVGSLDLKTGHLVYCNAGHNQPVLIRDGKATFMEVLPNIPVGAFEGFEYQAEETTLTKDDTFYIYTDGVTEAENIERKEYGDDRLLETLNRLEQKDPKSVLEGVIGSLKTYTVDADQSDDITMMAIALTEQR